MRFKIPSEIKNTLYFLLLASIMAVFFLLTVLIASDYLQTVILNV